MNTSNKMITILMVVAGSIISVALVSAAIVSSVDANKTGSIKTVDFRVYWDRSCTNRTSTINWGTMEPNTTKSFTVYVKNTGTIPERLSMRTSNWNPTNAQKYVTLTWDRENSILNRASSITATLTIRMSSNVTSLAEFNFDIAITGTQNRS
jgi:hypothetical protein